MLVSSIHSDSYCGQIVHFIFSHQRILLLIVIKVIDSQEDVGSLVRNGYSKGLIGGAALMGSTLLNIGFLVVLLFLISHSFLGKSKQTFGRSKFENDGGECALGHILQKILFCWLADNFFYIIALF